MANKKTIHVISGTHWDREWRFTAEQSLLRLAELVDSLLDILERNPEYKCFHLDGGTVVIEDYLAVRPENEERLCNLIKAGRIKSVMWYTLPEMSTVAPEALIRNLLMGGRYADKFGGSMKMGYTATSYGQISQLPQIYRGFGMDSAMSYRGTNKFQVPPICRWIGPDGSFLYHLRGFDEATRNNWFFLVHYELVLNKLPRDLRVSWSPQNWPVHMADDLYECAVQYKKESIDFVHDKQKQIDAIKHFVKQAQPQEINGHLLGLDMEDNACPYENMPALLKELNKAQDDYIVTQTSLEDYAEQIKKVCNDSDIPELKGEMRYNIIDVGFNGLLGATHSSRIYLKLMNDLAETELICVAEPLSSISSLLGGTYEGTLLDRAWMLLLKNHAHDSICGAAVDLAHKENPGRFRGATAIARECSRNACEQIWEKLDTSSKFNEKDLTLTFFNTLPYKRKGVHFATVDVPVVSMGDFLIEACTGAGPLVDEVDYTKIITYEFFDILDENGNKIPYKIIESEKVKVEIERKLDSNAAACDFIRTRMLLDVDIPSMGYKTYALRPRIRNFINNPKPGEDRALIGNLDGTLENKHLKVTIHSNGSFDVVDKASGKNYEGLHYFTNDGALGVAHRYLKPLRDYSITSLGSSADISLVENNTMRASWKIDITLRVPVCIDDSGRNRSPNYTELPVSTIVTLCKDSRKLEMKTRVINTARDHRLRVLFPTDIQTDSAFAGGPFDVLERQIKWDQVGDNAEPYYPIKPMHNFVSINDKKAGISFMSKGLNEYEVMDDKRRTIAVALLRTHRAYMLANTGAKTPDELERQESQHCIGTFDYEYALSFHDTDWKEADIVQESEIYKTPVRIIQGVPKKGKLPVTYSAIEIDEAKYIKLSAFYYDKESHGYVLRLWNCNNKDIKTNIKLAFAFSSITQVELDQKRVVKELSVSDGKISLKVGKAQIVTLLIK